MTVQTGTRNGYKTELLAVDKVESNLTKGGREKVVTRAVALAAMLPFVEAEQGLHGTVRKFERKF